MEVAERSTSYRVATNMGVTASPMDHSYSAADVEPVPEDPEDLKKKEEEEKKKKPDMVAFRKLFRFASGLDYFLLISGTFAAMLHGAMMPIFCIFFGDILQGYGEDADTSNTTGTDGLEPVKDASLYMLYLAIGGGLAAWVQLTAFMRTSQRQGTAIRNEYFKALLRQEVGWYDSQLTGQLTSRVAGDVTLIQDGIGDKLGTVIQFYTMFFVGFIIAFIYSWRLTLVILSLVPALAIGGALFGKFIAEAQTMGQADYADAGGVADEVLTLFRTVVAFDTIEREIKRYGGYITTARNRGVKSALMMGIGMGFTFFVIFCMYSLSFWFGSREVRDGNIETGDVVVAFFSVLIAAMGSGQAAPAMQAVMKGRGGAFAVFKVLERQSEIDSLSEEGVKPEKIVGDIEFKNVRFAYPTRKDEPVFTNLNLKVPANSTVAVVGESGCGKSTIANLCLRFYDPESGSVTLDGKDVSGINVQWLRTALGLVSQQPMLFPGTIYQNIAAGMLNPTKEDVERAAKEANAHDFISAFPHGYGTDVGDAGAQLSGGQKQRIAIARALIKNPKILVLDEATSALDTKSEMLVQEALQKLRHSRTTIVIAHRLSTVKDCDNIVVLGDGGVKEMGTHEELCALDGVYAAMVMAQELSEEQGKEEDEEIIGDEDAIRIISEAQRAASGSQGKKKKKEKKGKKKGKKGKDGDDNDEYDDEEELKALALGMGETSWAWKMAKPERFHIIIGVFMSALEGVGYVAWPLSLSQVIVELVTENREDVIQDWSIAFIGIGLYLFIVMGIKFYSLGWAGDNFTRRLRELSFRQLLSHEVGWYDMPGNSKGRLTARLAHDASKVRGLLADSIGAITQLFFLLVLGVGASMYYCWQVGLLLLATFPVIGIASGVQMKMMSGFSEFEDYEASGVYATHAIENIRTVLAMGRVKEYHGMYLDELDKVNPKLKRTAIVTGISFGITEFCMMGLWALAFWWGVWVIENNHCDFEEMFNALQCILFPAMLTGQVMSFMPNVKEAKLSVRRIWQLIGPDGKGHNRENATFLQGVQSQPDLKGKIEFKNVTFAYPSRPDVNIIENLSFTIEPGETVAMVGASGCGKSTIMALLQQFYKPDSGDIYMDGVPITQIEPSHYRAHLGYVAQEPQLFSMTIRENIAYGLQETPPMDRIEQAAKESNAHNFITRFKKGYETTVGEKGLKLSGGQRQRVAIARALIRQDMIKILLLDEATSALDTHSESIVQAELDKLTETRTTLMIAHRLSTVQNADRILVFDFGKIIEEGDHASLSAADGIYAKMCSNQSVSRGVSKDFSTF